MSQEKQTQNPVAEAVNFTKWDTADAVTVLGADAHFTLAPGGFLNMEYKDKTYPRIKLRRLQPLTNPSAYISVADEESNEIGIFPDLSVLPDDQRQLLEDALRFKYFTPRILSVSEIKERISYLFIDCVTSAGAKRICVSDYTSNMRVVGEASVSILDAQGNRYFIDDLRKLDKKSFQKLDQYL